MLLFLKARATDLPFALLEFCCKSKGSTNRREKPSMLFFWAQSRSQEEQVVGVVVRSVVERAMVDGPGLKTIQGHVVGWCSVLYHRRRRAACAYSGHCHGWQVWFEEVKEQVLYCTCWCLLWVPLQSEVYVWTNNCVFFRESNTGRAEGVSGEFLVLVGVLLSTQLFVFYLRPLCNIVYCHHDENWYKKR